RWSIAQPCFARTFRRKRSRRTFPPSTRRTYNTPGWPLDSVLHQGHRKGDCESNDSTVTAVDSVIAGRTHFAGIGAQTGREGLVRGGRGPCWFVPETGRAHLELRLRTRLYGRHNQRAPLHPSSERGSAPGPHRPPRERPDPRRTMGPHSTHNRPHFGIE